MRHHGAGLRRVLRDEDKVEAIITDWPTAPLTPREQAMCEYAVKLTRRPTSVTEGDIHVLRGVGLTDPEILDTCQIVAYFNYVNRLADGLGVELEQYWQDHA